MNLFIFAIMGLFLLVSIKHFCLFTGKFFTKNKSGLKDLIIFCLSSMIFLSILFYIDKYPEKFKFKEIDVSERRK